MEHLFAFMVLILLGVYSEVELLDRLVVPFVTSGGTVCCFPSWLQHLTFPPAAPKGSNFSTASPTLVICGLFDDSHSDGCEVIP